VRRVRIRDLAPGAAFVSFGRSYTLTADGADGCLYAMPDDGGARVAFPLAERVNVVLPSQQAVA
jgi:hypothetical protein